MPGMFNAGMLLLMLSCSAFAMEGPFQGGGKVEVNGQILASACSIHTDDVWQEIAFDNVSRQKTVDQRHMATKSFDIRLANCRLEKEDGGFWRSVIVTFGGEASPARHDLFAVNGSAEGLALLLTDFEGHQAAPGEPLPELLLKEKDNALHYNLSVVENGQALKEGDWVGYIRFMVAYE